MTQPALYAVEHINQTANLITRWEQIGRPVGPLAASMACSELQAISQESEILVYPMPSTTSRSRLKNLMMTMRFCPPTTCTIPNEQKLIYVARSNPKFLEDEAMLDSLGTMRYFNCAKQSAITSARSIASARRLDKSRSSN